MTDDIEPVRAREGGSALLAVTVTVVGLALVTPIATAVVVADVALWGLQMLGKQARRGTGWVLNRLIGSRAVPRV